MFHPYRIFLSISLLFFAAAATASQAVTVQAVEQNYEAVLHVVVSSTENAVGSPLPRHLEGVANRLGSNFGNSGYRLINTYLGRVANSGNLEFKGLSNIGVAQADGNLLSFVEWRLVNVRAAADKGGEGSISVSLFRFGARVPVQKTEPNESGKRPLASSYETIGLTLDKAVLPLGEPVILGTTSLPGRSGDVFIVLTVRAV
jgi:hypothetical protein